MRHLSRALLVGACVLALAVPAFAEPLQYNDTTTNYQGQTVTGPVAVSPSKPLPVTGTFSNGVGTYTATDKGGTITTGGTAQNAIASNASRKIWCIQNDPSATEILSVRSNGTASATAGTILQAGAQACTPSGQTDTAAISVFAATTGHRWFGFEGQ